MAGHILHLAMMIGRNPRLKPFCLARKRDVGNPDRREPDAQPKLHDLCFKGLLIDG